MTKNTTAKQLRTGMRVLAIESIFGDEETFEGIIEWESGPYMKGRGMYVGMRVERVNGEPVEWTATKHDGLKLLHAGSHKFQVINT